MALLIRLPYAEILPQLLSATSMPLAVRQLDSLVKSKIYIRFNDKKNLHILPVNEAKIQSATLPGLYSWIAMETKRWLYSWIAMETNRWIYEIFESIFIRIQSDSILKMAIEVDIRNIIQIRSLSIAAICVSREKHQPTIANESEWARRRDSYRNGFG